MARIFAKVQNETGPMMEKVRLWSRRVGPKKTKEFVDGWDILQKNGCEMLVAYEEGAVLSIRFTHDYLSYLAKHGVIDKPPPAC